MKSLLRATCEKVFRFGSLAHIDPAPKSALSGTPRRLGKSPVLSDDIGVITSQMTSGSLLLASQLV